MFWIFKFVIREMRFKKIFPKRRRKRAGVLEMSKIIAWTKIVK